MYMRHCRDVVEDSFSQLPQSVTQSLSHSVNQVASRWHRSVGVPGLTNQLESSLYRGFEGGATRSVCPRPHPMSMY